MPYRKQKYCYKEYLSKFTECLAIQYTEYTFICTIKIDK